MLLAAAFFWLQSPAPDTAGWIEKLRAPTAAERAGAERWLATHLSSADLDLVRAASKSGGAETRRRLALALADSDDHVALSVALAADKESGAVEVGRAALEERIARWCPAWTRKGLSRADAMATFARRHDRPIRLDPRTEDRRLDVALDQLARFAPGAVPLVLDPDLATSEHPRDAATSIEGNFARALGELVRLHRADLEGFALAGDDDPDAPPDPRSEARPHSGHPGDEPMRPWIRIRRAVAGPARTGSEWIVEWCVGVASGTDPARRAACARAVASTGWPPAIAWLERRAFEERDEAALEGILLAAGRGQPADALRRPETTRDLLSSLGRIAGAQGGSHSEADRADSIARAIASAGPIGPKGEDLAAIVADGLERLPAREAWLRLVALEGMRSPSPKAVAAIEAVLAGKNVPPPLRFEALRARLATGSAASARPRVEDAPAALAWSFSAGADRECVRLLVALGVPPPTAPADAPADASRPAAIRLAELEWSLFTGDGALAGPRVGALAADESRGGIGLEALANRTRTWVREGASKRLEAAIAAALASAGADVERLEHLAILSGAGSADLRGRWSARLVSASTSREDVLGLGVLAANADGAAARKEIVRLLSEAGRVDDAVAAASLAVEGLWGALRDEEAFAFTRAVADAAANGSKELKSKLRLGTWPPRKASELVNAASLDRAVERSGL